MSPKKLRMLALSPLAIAFASCAFDSKPAPVSKPAKVTATAAVLVAAASSPEQDDDEPTGKSLYQRHCAGCHNDNGDGHGATMIQKGIQARSFAQGGFAFGNTPDAIFKTITSGIPGSSLMQPFKSLMDDDERMLVAKYVLTLTPYKDAVPAIGSIMKVRDRAVFAYGKLPAIHDGLPERPRGLMVGLPGGLSFEYRRDDVELLAVRRGAFVDRTDWNERGGGMLKPLGDVVFEIGSGKPQPWLQIDVDGKMVPIEFDVAATRTSGKSGRDAQIEMRPKPGTPPSLIRVVETLFQPELSEPLSFGRRFVFEQTAHPRGLFLNVVDCAEGILAVPNQLGGPLMVATHPPDGRSSNSGLIGWIVLNAAGARGGFDCVYYKSNRSPQIGGTPTSLVFSLIDNEHTDPRPPEVSIVVVHVTQWDEALLERLSKELAQ